MVWHWCVMYSTRVNGGGLKAGRKRRVNTKPSKSWQERKFCSKTRSLHSSSHKRGVTEDKTGNIRGRSARDKAADSVVYVRIRAVHAESLQMDALGENGLSVKVSVTYLLTGRQRVPSGWWLYLQSSWPSRPCLCAPSWGSWCQSSQTLLEASGCWPLHKSTHSSINSDQSLQFQKKRSFSPFFRL